MLTNSSFGRTEHTESPVGGKDRVAKGTGCRPAGFGGHRLSGMGNEGGRAGLDEFLCSKNVYIPL